MLKRAEPHTTTEAIAGTPRVSLAPRSEADAVALFALMNDREVVRMLADPPWPLTEEDVRRHLATPAHRIEGFTILADGAPIGEASLKLPGSGNPPRTMPRLGYWIGRRFWEGHRHAGGAAAHRARVRNHRCGRCRGRRLRRQSRLAPGAGEERLPAGRLLSDAVPGTRVRCDGR